MDNPQTSLWTVFIGTTFYLKIVPRKIVDSEVSGTGTLFLENMLLSSFPDVIFQSFIQLHYIVMKAEILEEDIKIPGTVNSRRDREVFFFSFKF